MSGKGTTLIVGLLGVLCGLLLLLVIQTSQLPGASGQAASTSGLSGEWLMGVATTTGGQAACYLFNTKEQKLGLYVTSGTTFNLRGVRLCTFDFGVQQWPTRGIRPSVLEMKKMAKK